MQWFLFLCSPEKDYGSWGAGSHLGTEARKNTLKLRTWGDGQNSKVCGKEKKPLGWGLGQESGACRISGFGYYVVHGADKVQEFMLWPEQAFVRSSSRLVYAIDCWPLEADFPFSNKNFFVVSCFTHVLKC